MFKNSVVGGQKCINCDLNTSAIAPTRFTPKNRHILKFNNLLQPGYAFKSFQISFKLKKNIGATF